jgi:hypothetical protein
MDADQIARQSGLSISRAQQLIEELNLQAQTTSLVALRPESLLLA